MTSDEQSRRNRPDSSNRPTNVRLAVVMVATAMSVLLYLDRFCVSFAADYIKEDLQLTQSEVGYFLSAFFFSYALAQVPAGWLSDRYGARIMLAIYIVAWSLFTAMIGAVYGLGLLLFTRMACGLAQAGAYPTSASVLSKWVPFRKRGTASAWISLGGRLGGAIAPLLTAYLIVLFVPAGTPVELTASDLIDAPRLCNRICPREELQSSTDGNSVVGSPSQKSVDPFSRHIWSLLNREAQQHVCECANRYRRDEATQQKLDNPKIADGATISLLVALNGLLDSPKLYDEAAFKSTSLPREAIVTLTRQRNGEPVSISEQRRFNRLLLEAGLPNNVAKIYVRGWRPVMFVYGGAGIIVAALVWIVFRSRPEQHPWCNSLECELIATGRPPNAPGPHGKAGMVPIWGLLKSGSIWLDCLCQVGTNVGWVFIVTWLPRFLISQHNVPVLERGLMAMIPLLVGIVGMYCGGWLTDLLTGRLGVRWGRTLPIALSRFIAAVGYGLCMWFSTFAADSPINSPWMYVGAFSLVAFSTDLGVPATWAFKQDIGGRYVGSILGWGNMWGNLGASAAPPLYDYFLGESPGPAEWNAMFLVCIAAFLFAGICGMGIDASKPIAPQDENISESSQRSMK